MNNPPQVIDATITIYPNGSFNIQSDWLVKLSMQDSIPVSRIARLIAAVPVNGREDWIDVPMPEGADTMKPHELAMYCFNQARKQQTFQRAVDEARFSQSAYQGSGLISTGT